MVSCQSDLIFTSNVREENCSMQVFENNAESWLIFDSHLLSFSKDFFLVLDPLFKLPRVASRSVKTVFVCMHMI